MKKKRIRIQKKNGVIILVFIFLGVMGITLYRYITVQNIIMNYNKYVITHKKTNLYDKNENVIGIISKNIELELQEIKEIKLKDKYFQIKNTNCYIYYQDVSPLENIEKEQINKNYLPLNKNIQSTGEISLYKNNKKIITLNSSLDIPIQYIVNDTYYIYYLNKLLEVKPNHNIKISNNTNSKVKNSSHISVLFYDEIKDTCSNYNCTTINSLIEQIKKLKENGYYSITLNEYKDFLKGNLNLKEKAILITTNEEIHNINNLNEQLNISIEKNIEEKNFKFQSTNKTSTSETDPNYIDRYQIKSYTTIDNLLKMANGETILEKDPTISTTKPQEVPVLNYHFFYDPYLGETCNEGICLTVQKFEEHLVYLKNNGYKTLTIDEFKKWMYNELELPNKSVLITIDDGAMGTGFHNGNKLIPLLEKYDLYATLFLISGWWDISNYISPNLDIQSHTNDMHQYGTCKKGQINCQPYEEVIADLQQSINIIGRTESFCFPFYYSSEKSIQAVKEVGFKLAFVGGNKKTNRTNNKYLIPRYPIHSDITMEEFINIVK